MPQIDAVERLLMVVGIDAILSRDVERFGKTKLRRAAGIPDEVSALAGKMVRGDLEPDLTLSDLDWRKAVKELVAGWDVEQVTEMVSRFPPEYQAAASALVIKSVALVKQLSDGLPIAKYQTMTGAKDMVAADVAIFRFSSVLEVVRNPLIVFQLMAGGALLKIQAHAVRTVYPTLSAAIDAAIFNATTMAKAR